MESGKSLLADRDIENYGLMSSFVQSFELIFNKNSRNNLSKYRKGFDLYIRKRDRLSKIISDIATDLEMMKHVRLVQNKDIKRRVKNLMQKIIDGLFIDPNTIQIDQRELKYENVYNG